MTTGLIVVTGQGTLTIAGVSMNNTAWNFDLSPLWDSPDKRGENAQIAQLGGRRAYRRWPDQTVYSLEGRVVGNVTHTDTPNANISAGLVANQDYLIDNVESVASASLAAVLTMPDGSTREADVQAAFVFGKLEGDAVTSYDKPVVLMLTVVSEAGRFVEAGS